MYNRYVARQAKKRKAIKYKGGSCDSCGIDLLKKPWLAEFHHIDPDTKEHKPSDLILDIYWREETLIELDKCSLLCRNCHADVHADSDKFLLLEEEIEYYCENEIAKRISTKKERQEAIKLREKGLSYREISEIIPFGEETIRKWMPPKKKLSEEFIKNKIVEEHNKGTALNKISRVLKMRYETTIKHFEELLLDGKVTPRNKRQLNKLKRLQKTRTSV